nr:pitrilysin family protein [Nocardioides plantarum]
MQKTPQKTAQEAPQKALQKTGTTRTLSTVRDSEGAITSRVRRTVLPGGLRVVTEQMAGARSATIGVWVDVGSRDETTKLHGCSHFLEHLLFKGTHERSALDISVALDAVGGEFNAFTAKEYTCFHARVLDEDLPLAVDVLGDMITSSLLSPDDVEAEREVILDEIAMHDDDPDDVVHNLFAEQTWGPTSPLGRSISGTEESIAGLDRATIQRFYRRHYRPEHVVVSVAGSLDHAAVVRHVKRFFGRRDWLAGEAEPVGPRRGAKRVRVHPGHVETTRPFEQVNVVLGMEAFGRDDERRFALGVLNTALGGGTSSRLFQEIRERRGLAYSVYSFTSHYADSGVVGVAVGCLPAKLDEVLANVRLELSRVAADGITEDELVRGKGQLRGGLVLGLEDSASRMIRLGKAELIHDELLEIDEIMARIDAVTLDEVREVAAEVFSRREILAVVGPS